MNKGITIGEILDKETEFVLHADKRYGDYFTTALEANELLFNFLESVSKDRFIFCVFLSHLQKHITLALFSTVRLHLDQAMMDLRQVLESGVYAAFAIENTNSDDFVDVNNQMHDVSEKNKKKRYSWLNKNFIKSSDFIKNMKNLINKSSAHSGLLSALKVFNINEDESKFSGSFFDEEDDYHVKSDLWLIANIAIGLMDLFYGVNQKVNALKFAENFVQNLKNLELKNKKCQEELKKHDRYLNALKSDRN